MTKRIPLKGFCSVDGCGRAVATLQRCSVHRAEMSPSEVEAGRLEANARKSLAKRGEKNPMFGRTREKHPRWTGNSPTYGAVHDWMSDTYGQPIGCEVCGTNDPLKRYEWANLSGQYRRDRDDFKRMCKSCHNNHDGVNAHQVGSPSRKNRPMTNVGGVPVSSKYKGVRASGYGTWRATFAVDGKYTNLGSFATEELAAAAYNQAVVEAHGADAYINEIP